MNRHIAVGREEVGPLGPAAALFHRLEQALARRDYAEARSLTRELRRAGFSVVRLGQHDNGRHERS
jgi:hypothetical protein